jgi:hypothetical protein
MPILAWCVVIGVAWTLTVELASRKAYELDKFRAMASFAASLLRDLTLETGKTAHDVLVSLPPLSGRRSASRPIAIAAGPASGRPGGS